MNTERWLAVQTQSRREQWAAENIDRLGYSFYFPKIQTVDYSPRGGLRLARVEPLFPRHLFVRSDEGQWRSLTGCWGVSGIVMCGEGPAFMPAKEIHRLQALEDSDGMIMLPDREKVLPLSKHRIGDTVRVSAGAFAGLVGIYQGDAPKDRLKVMLDVLGRKTAVLIMDSHVEAV